MAARSVLLAVGGPTEILGIALVSLDILAPTFRAGARALAAQRERVLEWVRSRVATMRGDVTVAVNPGGARAGGVSPVGIQRPSDGPFMQRFESLVNIVVDMQLRLDRGEQQMAEDRASASRGIAQLRREFDVAISDALRQSESAYLRWRGLGFALALIGASMIYAAAFV